MAVKRVLSREIFTCANTTWRNAVARRLVRPISSCASGPIVGSGSSSYSAIIAPSTMPISTRTPTCTTEVPATPSWRWCSAAQSFSAARSAGMSSGIYGCSSAGTWWRDELRISISRASSASGPPVSLRKNDATPIPASTSALMMIADSTITAIARARPGGSLPSTVDASTWVSWNTSRPDSSVTTRPSFSASHMPNSIISQAAILATGGLGWATRASCMGGASGRGGPW